MPNGTTHQVQRLVISVTPQSNNTEGTLFKLNGPMVLMHVLLYQVPPVPLHMEIACSLEKYSIRMILLLQQTAVIPSSTKVMATWCFMIVGEPCGLPTPMVSLPGFALCRVMAIW